MGTSSSIVQGTYDALGSGEMTFRQVTDYFHYLTTAKSG